MGKRKELSLDEKVSLVEECLTGRLRMREAARRAGVGRLNHGELDQPVPLGGDLGVRGEWKPVKAAIR